MKRLLPPEEFADFLSSYESPPVRGLRCNSLKGDAAQLTERSGFTLSPVPWTADGFYYTQSDRPGRHVLHEAGAYYIQEPSAMLPAALLDPAPGEVVLDLCAAPGGKTTQLAAGMHGQGLLVANEIHPARARVLSENVERMGIRNCIVLNEEPDRLAACLPFFFDKILVDAPCSGEGMFRKNPESISEWSPENVTLCAARQDRILDAAVRMMRPGGTLVYATCTFNRSEDEDCIARFLTRHPDFSLVRCEKLLPHKVRGEGQFAVVLTDTESVPLPRTPAADRKYSGSKKAPVLPEEVTSLLRDPLPEERLLSFGDQLYLLPEYAIPLDGLKVLRPGLHLGGYEGKRRDRFVPSHALALALSEPEVTRAVTLTTEEAAAYIAGNALPCDAENGWCILFTAGYSLGIGKVVNHTLKNHYPKGLRKHL